MVSRMSFLVICFMLGVAVAWQDAGSDQINSLQDIIDRHFAQESHNALIAKRSQSEMMGRQIRVCGRQLVNMLQLVCRFNQASNRRKRSIGESPDSVLVSLLANSGMKTELGDYPVGGGVHLVKRGASQDCCHSPCTMGHLMNYCPK